MAARRDAADAAAGDARALVAGGVGGGAVAVALAPAAAASVGFTSAGILAGSPAAAAMSAAAVANGGGVASFSAIAGLQSVGAVGLATSTAAGMAVLGTICVGGGAVGAGAVWARRKYLQRQDRLRLARWSALPSVVTWSAHPLAAPGGPGAERASPGMGAVQEAGDPAPEGCGAEAEPGVADAESEGTGEGSTASRIIDPVLEDPSARAEARGLPQDQEGWWPRWRTSCSEDHV